MRFAKHLHGPSEASVGARLQIARGGSREFTEAHRNSWVCHNSIAPKTCVFRPGELFPRQVQQASGSVAQPFCDAVHRHLAFSHSGAL
jgi:hypothetical protein